MANIGSFLNRIKTAMYGKEVRGSIHDAVDAINKETESATTLSKDTQHKQTALEKKYDNQIANMTNENPSISELVDFRTSMITGETFTTAGKRADAVDIQLASMKTNQMQLNKDIKGKGISIVWHGAKSMQEDKTFDNTYSIQAAIDYIKNNQPNFPFSGGTIYIPFGTYKFNEVLIDTPHVNIIGEGTLSGTLKIRSVERANPNNDNNILDMFIRIEGLRFIHDEGNQTDAIVIQNTRCVTIVNCYFENYHYAVHGEAIHDDVPYQQTARVIVSDCLFKNVDNCVRASWIPWYEGVHVNWRYNQHGDWQVKGCQAYYYNRGITHYHFEGMDGLIVTNNILFHQLYRLKNKLKKHNIYVKQSNFVIISNNDLFEAGDNSIHIEDPRSCIISSNNIAWPGQVVPGAGIYLETADKSTYVEAAINIANNNITYPTLHGISIGYNIINCKVDGTNITATGNGKFYYGDPDLSKLNHYSIFVAESTSGYEGKQRVIISNNYFDKPIFQIRGVSLNNLPLSYLDKNQTFGNINVTPRTVNDVLDLSPIINKNTNPINESAPFILKNLGGTITQITGAKPGQIVTLICGNAVSVVLTNTGTGPDLLNIGSKITLTASQYITLQKTDTYWIKL